MEKSGYAESFRDLLAYQKARELARDVFEVSKRFPKEEMFALAASQTSSANPNPNISPTTHRSPITDNRLPITEHGASL